MGEIVQTWGCWPRWGLEAKSDVRPQAPLEGGGLCLETITSQKLWPWEVKWKRKRNMNELGTEGVAWSGLEDSGGPHCGKHLPWPLSLEDIVPIFMTPTALCVLYPVHHWPPSLVTGVACNDPEPPLRTYLAHAQQILLLCCFLLSWEGCFSALFFAPVGQNHPK